MCKKHRIERLFGDLIELETPEERSELLGRIAADDAKLGQHLERLINAHEQADSFLHDSEVTTETSSILIGDSIGPYKLREVIGEGGMGTVYAAEQQKPLRRKVAIKVVKPGMDTKAVLARFEAEQQALAMMSHRNIAKVLDAGTTPNGRPYFVMELVQGIPITQYCDDKSLAITDRLELFIQVCLAIQHAHQKGIIHRDIKPSNVLVTEEDGRAIPKVIDFGVAKALSQNLTDRTLYTNFQAFVGTPLYASPEQASLSNVDVDTRSDVYSLGVLLYELITGSTPYDKRQLQEAAYEEMCRIIREHDAVRPSTRLSALGHTASEVSENRSSDPSRLARSVRGDLDWIVLKALEKDRARRYEGANSFAKDIQNFLNSEVVVARPPSQLYRFSRACARNRTAVISGLVVVMGLAIGLGASLILLQQKNRILVLHQTQTIESAFEHAMNGAETDFRASLAIAQEAKVSESWLDTLRGMMAYHRGENERAIGLFDRALDVDRDNTAAWGLKALALINQGQLHEWTAHVARIDEFEIRPGYEAVDRLCVAYATYHIDLEKAVVDFEAVLKDHPTWNMVRSMYAAALAEYAEMSGNLELMHDARKESSVAHHITNGNQFTQAVYVFVRNLAVRADSGKRESILAETRPVAADLGAHEQYHMGQLFVADHYTLVSEYTPSKEAQDLERTAWTQFPNLRDNYASRVFAELFRLGEDDRVIQAAPADIEAKIARAIVLAHREDTRQEAIDVLTSNSESLSSWYIRLKAIELELVLRHGEHAKQRCQAWLNINSEEPVDKLSKFYIRLMQRIADGDLEAFDVASPWERFQKEYYLALLSYSVGDSQKAKQHLSYCVEHRSINAADHWARAFMKRWEVN